MLATEVSDRPFMLSLIELNKLVRTSNKVLCFYNDCPLQARGSSAAGACYHVRQPVYYVQLTICTFQYISNKGTDCSYDVIYTNKLVILD